MHELVISIFLFDSCMNTHLVRINDVSGGTKGEHSTTPADSVRCCSFCRIPGDVGFFELLFCWPPPGFHWSSHLPFTLRIPLWGLPGCVRCWFPQSVADPIPFAPGDLRCRNTFLPCCCQSSLLLIFSGQYIFRIFLRHWLMKVFSLLDMDLVTLQVSEPLRRTDFTLVVKIRSLVLVDLDVEIHTGLRVLKACLALPILLFTSLSALSDVMTLPK